MNDAEFEINLKPIEILLVEDNLGDARLILETFKDGKIQNRLHLAKDGAKGLEYLYACLEDGGPPLPELILMDLNLPGMDGWELLQTIKSDPALRCIPVVILTSSESERDIRRSYELSANCYLTKPVELAAFMTVVLSIEHFWCSIVKLPKG
jgi:CheY-like chemotaxis protein